MRLVQDPPHEATSPSRAVTLAHVCGTCDGMRQHRGSGSSLQPLKVDCGSLLNSMQRSFGTSIRSSISCDKVTPEVTGCRASRTTELQGGDQEMLQPQQSSLAAREVESSSSGSCCPRAAPLHPRSSSWLLELPTDARRGRKLQLEQSL